MKQMAFACITLMVFFLCSCQTTMKGVDGKGMDKKKLSWSKHPNTKGNLKGFRLYVEQNKAGKGKLLLDIKDPAATEVSLASFIDKLDFSRANYLYLTAYDTGNNESNPSGKVCWGKECKK